LLTQVLLTTISIWKLKFLSPDGAEHQNIILTQDRLNESKKKRCGFNLGVNF
jgi:hypothetical protein